MGKTSSRSELSTRADRKFEQKLQFYGKVRDTVVQKTISKNKKVRSRKKKLKAYDLSTLSEVLPELKAPTQPEFKLNSKFWQHLVLKESNQFKTVLSHPTFQSNPLGAIHQHLQSTQPAEEKPKRKNFQNVKKMKKKKKKPSTEPLSMEI